jgi:hypothetical protein
VETGDELEKANLKDSSSVIIFYCPFSSRCGFGSAAISK